MKATEKLFVIRWWSKSAVTRMEDVTLNPTEYNHMLIKSGDAMSISIYSVADLLEFFDDNDPRNE